MPEAEVALFLRAAFIRDIELTALGTNRWLEG